MLLVSQGSCAHTIRFEVVFEHGFNLKLNPMYLVFGLND